MNLTCPCCGGTASLEALTNDSEARAVIARISTLPQPVAASTPGYLGLFRPDKRALSWRKANSIVTALASLVSLGYVQVKGKADRDCSARIWAQAMDDMVNRRDRLTRPLPNHNYLRQVAHDMAAMEDATQERGRVLAEQTHQRPVARVNQGPQTIKSIMQQYIDGDIDHMPGDSVQYPLEWEE